VICKDKLSLCTTRRHKGSASRPGRFIQGNIHPYPTNRRLWGLEVRSRHFWRTEEIFPQAQPWTIVYKPEDYMWNLKDKTVTCRYPPNCINALVPRESTCGWRTTALLPRTWRVADQAPNVHVLVPMPLLIKDKPRTLKRTEQPVAAELRNWFTISVKWRQTKQTILGNDLLVHLFLVR
jgi:hypothetical protein